MKRFLIGGLMLFWAALVAAQTPPKPGPKDLCPVCGMLVAKYPNWAATIIYEDGHAHHFDGAKDLFKFWFEPARYAAGHTREAMVSLWVTDFYNLRKINARKAWYVAGSDVLGPMGHELVPLASKADADDFVKDHKGVKVLTFDQVTRELPAQLDLGKF